MIGYALFALMIAAGIAGLVWGCIPPKPKHRDEEESRD